VRTIYLKSLIRDVNNCDAYQKRIKMCIEPYELLCLAFKIQCKIEKKSGYIIESINRERARYAFMSTKTSIRIKQSLLDTKLQAQGGQLHSIVILNCTGPNTCRSLKYAPSDLEKLLTEYAISSLL
jgi:hypothetical protein